MSKATDLAKQKRNLKNKTKALRRQAAMIRKVGDEVHSVARDVGAAMDSAEERGWLNGMHTAINLAESARTIGDVRKRLSERLELGR